MLELIYNGEVHYRSERNHHDSGKERQPCGGHNNESRAICHIDSDTCPAREKIVYCNLNGECKNKRAGVS